jgi:hypothetical protein
MWGGEVLETTREMEEMRRRVEVVRSKRRMMLESRRRKGRRRKRFLSRRNVVDVDVGVVGGVVGVVVGVRKRKEKQPSRCEGVVEEFDVLVVVSVVVLGDRGMLEGVVS